MSNSKNNNYFNLAALTPIKQKQFLEAFSKILPFVKRFPDRVALLKVMTVLKMEKIVSKDINQKDLKMIQILKRVLIMKDEESQAKKNFR